MRGNATANAPTSNQSTGTGANNTMNNASSNTAAKQQAPGKPAPKSETVSTMTQPGSQTARPFAVSNTNMLGTPAQNDAIKAALDTLGIKLIKSEAEREVLKKLVEETRNTQQRLERELLENRKELSEQRRKMEEHNKEAEATKNRHERLEERLRESQANALKLTRKLEADEQKRTRLTRRMERLESVAEEAQAALQSRAMVLLTDQTLAQKSGLPLLEAAGPAMPLPAGAKLIGSSGASAAIIDPDAPAAPWWKTPLHLNTSVAAAAIVLALGFGFLVSSSMNNNSQSAVAFLQDGSLARINLADGTLQPLQLSLTKLDNSTAAQDLPNMSENGQPLPLAKPESMMAPTQPVTDAAAPARDSSLNGALKELQDKAYAGVPEAQHDLAALYTAGSGVKQDYKRATYWFTQAANAGIGNAAYNLGVLNHQGLGTPKNIDRALDWYRIAALEGHPEAQYNLGIAYIEGIGTKYNPQLAAGFFKSAALMGIAEAAYNLGLILENGLLAEPKPNQALMWYRVGAESGSSEARNALTQLAERLGLSPDKAGFLPDGTSLSKLVIKPGRANSANGAAAMPDLSKVLPELTDMIPNRDQLLTAQVQEQLGRRNIYNGPEDGAMGQKTISAIREYQKAEDMPAKGEPTADLLLHMLKQSVTDQPVT